MRTVQIWRKLQLRCVNCPRSAVLDFVCMYDTFLMQAYQWGICNSSQSLDWRFTFLVFLLLWFSSGRRREKGTTTCHVPPTMEETHQGLHVFLSLFRLSEILARQKHTRKVSRTNWQRKFRRSRQASWDMQWPLYLKQLNESRTEVGIDLQEWTYPASHWLDRPGSIHYYWSEPNPPLWDTLLQPSTVCLIH